MEAPLYFYDTNAISYLIQGVPDYVEGLAQIPREDLFLPEIARDEILRGLRKPSRLTDDQKSSIWERVRVLEVVPETELSLTIAAEIRENLKVRAIHMGDDDVRIASVSLASGATLITHNLRHLGRIRGLKIKTFGKLQKARLAGIMEAHERADGKVLAVEEQLSGQEIDGAKAAKLAKSIFHQLDREIGEALSLSV